MESNAVMKYDETRPDEAPFDEPVEEPPAHQIPYAEPCPDETPGRPADPKPVHSPPEVLRDRDR